MSDSRKRRRQFGLGFVGRLAAAHDLDDFVDVVERDAVAFEQMRALFGLAQIVARAPRDDVFAMRDEMLEQRLEVEHLRLERDRSVGPRFADRHQRQHVETEARLQRRVLEELIEHDLGRRGLLQLDDDFHALAVGEVVEARDPLDLLLGVGFGDCFDDAALVDLIRNLRDHDPKAAFFLDDLGLAAHRDRTATRAIGFANRFGA